MINPAFAVRIQQPRPAEHAGSLWKNGRRMDCGLYFHGKSRAAGRFSRAMTVSSSRQRFIFKQAALRLAGELRQDLEREGWRLSARLR
jgi:hypothetical protein